MNEPTRSELPPPRELCLQQLQQRPDPWDIVVIGGGATGVGVALDATTRGLSVLLVERADFGKGTSSRSTKLVHGGVRYLQQGNISLVREALRERARLRANAPHLVHDLRFLIPCQGLFEKVYYRTGLTAYDLLATGGSFGRSTSVSASEARRLVPAVSGDKLSGGVIYHDGQFDDTRLLIAMARTAIAHGATLLNYVAASGLTRNRDGKIDAVELTDQETNQPYTARARCVVNATGPFCDHIRELDSPQAKPIISASQGVHVVVPKELFPGDVAMIVPKTSDGRVLFIIPWYQHALIGTTDTPVPEATLEPRPQPQELEFLLSTASEFLTKRLTPADVLSVFTGIRPLVRDDSTTKTSSLSRDHHITISESGLVTITGGKWTTVRRMSEDCVDRAIASAGLPSTRSVTADLRLQGWLDQPTGTDHVSDHRFDWRHGYGSELPAVEQLESEQPELAAPLHSRLPYRGSDVIWAVRYEMARNVEDVLARRTRSLFLDAEAALEIAPQVAELMAAELGHDQAWQNTQLHRFAEVAVTFQPFKQ